MSKPSGSDSVSCQTPLFHDATHLLQRHCAAYCMSDDCTIWSNPAKQSALMLSDQYSSRELAIVLKFWFEQVEIMLSVKLASGLSRKEENWARRCTSVLIWMPPISYGWFRRSHYILYFSYVATTPDVIMRNQLGIVRPHLFGWLAESYVHRT